VIRLLAAVLLVGASLSTAAAQPSSASPELVVDQPRRERAISVGLWSLMGLSTVAGQYEQQLSQRRWSWVAGGGVRSGAGGDYRSTTLAAGGELRYWLRGRAIWSDAAPASMVGWFAGARVDIAWTRTVDQIRDRTAGNNLALAVTGNFGYRFLIRGRVELATWVGMGGTREIDLGGRLPGYTRPSPRLGTSLGWCF
jgi:hypothetical protein